MDGGKVARLRLLLRLEAADARTDSSACYEVCYVRNVRTITHRELRNNSAEILRRVANGEAMEVSNRGVVVATLTPATTVKL